MADDGEIGPVFTLATGPAGATPATLAALSQPILHHLDPAFRVRYAQTAGLLQQAFGTEQAPVIFPGEAVTGLEAAAASLIGPDDVVLNLVSGIYGQAFGRLAGRYAAEVSEIRAGYDSAVPAGQVAHALRERPEITIVSVVHCETPSGTLNDLSAIAAATAGSGALLLVDAVSSFGGERCDFAGWPADLAVVAPQKCLGGPPGLSLLHVSDRAWQHMTANPRAPRGSALSILDWRDVHLDGHAFPFTPNVTEINALHSCLAQYLAEGPAAVRERHRAAARSVRAGAVALGLGLWAKDPAIRASTVTAVEMPPGVDEARVRAVARAEYGVMLAGGQGDFAGRVLQIGHMGPAAYPMAPVIALTALGGALRRAGAKADVGAAVEAALAANAADTPDDTQETTPEEQ
jgi:pyridoxamine---pyruvate transaminase